jgi:L-ascorbate metabolism protein UlaG (beta-lactamase superfamily)
MFMAEQPGAELLARINNLHVPHGQIALWSLGQSGFAIKGGTTIAYIDPYLSGTMPRRRIPVPIQPSAISNAHVVFATHEHLDHADPNTLGPLLQASPAATLVTSQQGSAIMRQAGVDAARIVVPRIGEHVELAGLHYTAIPAGHYEYEVDEVGRARWMGFLIDCNGVTIYHSGDTILFPELLQALDGTTIDIALLPTNGRDFFREEHDIVGNLWPQEAVQLADRIGAKVLIGTHNDMFAGNRLPSGMLYDARDQFAPNLRCHTLQAGELYLYAG